MELLASAPPRRRVARVTAGVVVTALAGLALVLGVGRADPKPTGVVLTLQTAAGPIVWDLDAGSPAPVAPADTTGSPASVFAGLPDLLPRGSRPVGRTSEGVLVVSADAALGLWDPSSQLITRRWPLGGEVTDTLDRWAVVVPPCGAARCVITLVDTRGGATADLPVPPGWTVAGPVRLGPGTDGGPEVAYVATDGTGGTGLVAGPMAAPRVLTDVAPLPERPVWITDRRLWVVQSAEDRVAVGRLDGTDVRAAAVPAGRLLDAR